MKGSLAVFILSAAGRHCKGVKVLPHIIREEVKVRSHPSYRLHFKSAGIRLSREQ
jgi:hypothetical protein